MILERSVSLSEAEAVVDKYFVDNNLLLTHAKYGEVLSSTVASIYDVKTGEKLCVGCGKGYEKEALIGAKYETYEHYEGLPALRRASKLVPYEDIIAQKDLKNLLPMRLLSNSKPTAISAVEFTGPISNNYPLLWPSYLIDYNYPFNKLSGDDADYKDACRYSCGTGLAAGVGYHEAAIHAISEIIERHCVGSYLARNYFYDLNDKLHCVRRETLPEHVRETYEEACKALGAAIQLIDISQKGLPPVYIACCKEHPVSGIQIFGAGCSYYASHSAHRAIKELVQQYEVERGVSIVKQEWRKHKAHLLKYPHLLKCFLADISDKKHVAISFRKDASLVSLEEHLAYLHRACAERGLPVWAKEIHKTESGLSLVCAVMPLMERFSIVSLGNYVIPTTPYETYLELDQENHYPKRSVL